MNLSQAANALLDNLLADSTAKSTTKYIYELVIDGRLRAFHLPVVRDNLYCGGLINGSNGLRPIGRGFL